MNYYTTRDTLIRPEGIAVLKTLATVDGKPVEQTRDGAYVLSAGNMYKVTLSVVVPQERDSRSISEPHPLRKRDLRCRGCVPSLLRQTGVTSVTGRIGVSHGSAELPFRR